MQGCGLREKPGSHISCSRECRKVWKDEPSHSQVSSHFGSRSPDGFPNLQRAILGVKTYWIEKFLISLESSWISSHDPFGHLKHKLWPKEGPWVKLAICLLTIKSWELPQFPCEQVACDILLESSRRGLQLWLRLHFNWRFAHKVMGLQSCESPNFGNFRIRTWESLDKMTLGCWSHGRHIVYYKGGRWWLPPSLGHDESCEFVFARGSFVHQSVPTTH